MRPLPRHGGPRQARRAWRALLLSLPCTIGTARATVPDTFGAGAEQAAMGGGGVAHVDDGNAAMLNPAGLHHVRRPTLSAGFLWGIHRLRVQPDVYWDTNRDGLLDDRDDPLSLGPRAVDDTYGFQISVGRHIGSRFGLGLSIYLPANRLFRLKTYEPAIPTYILHDNRGQRYALAAGLGGEVLPGVSLGAAIDFVPRVRFDVGMTADIAITGDNEDAQDLGDTVTRATIDIHEIELDVIPGLAPMVGLQLDLGKWTPRLRGLTLGATWRGSVGIPIEADLDIQANVGLEDVGSLDPFAIAAVIEAGLLLFDHYLPMRVDFGFALDLPPWLRGSIDARWTDWRRLLLSVARIDSADLTTPLFDLDDAIVDGNTYRLVTRSTWSVRGGAQLNFPRVEFDKRVRYLQIWTRAGVGWEQGPLVDQGQRSNFLDGDRWWLTGGLGGEVWDPTGLLDGAIRLDTFFQYHRLVPNDLLRATDAPRPGYPVDSDRFTAAGEIVVLGVEVGFDY